MSPLFPEETGQSDQLICEMQSSLPEGEIKLTSVVDGYISTAVTSQSRLTGDSFNSLFGNGLSKSIKRRHWHVTEEKRRSLGLVEKKWKRNQQRSLSRLTMLLKHTSGTIMSLVVVRQPQRVRVCGYVEAEYANKIQELTCLPFQYFREFSYTTYSHRMKKNSITSTASHPGKLHLLITYTIS